jgi:hypothetical protein
MEVSRLDKLRNTTGISGPRLVVGHVFRHMSHILTAEEGYTKVDPLFF